MGAFSNGLCSPNGHLFMGISYGIVLLEIHGKQTATKSDKPILGWVYKWGYQGYHCNCAENDAKQWDFGSSIFSDFQPAEWYGLFHGMVTTFSKVCG